jgi:hypothetical protein
MKRRAALKNLGLATGFFAITPSVVSLLQSCTSNAEAWVPELFTEEQGRVLTKLVDIILPKTESLPSANELNVPQFIDKYYQQVLDNENKNKITSAFKDVIEVLKVQPEDKIDDVSEDSFIKLLDDYMLLKTDVDKEREANPESLSYTKSEFLNELKFITIRAYLTTEQMGENVLVYDPVPSQYYCGDLNELTGGKTWSLGNSLMI